MNFPFSLKTNAFFSFLSINPLLLKCGNGMCMCLRVRVCLSNVIYLRSYISVSIPSILMYNDFKIKIAGNRGEKSRYFFFFCRILLICLFLFREWGFVTRCHVVTHVTRRQNIISGGIMALISSCHEVRTPNLIIINIISFLFTLKFIQLINFLFGYFIQLNSFAFSIVLQRLRCIKIKRIGESFSLTISR